MRIRNRRHTGTAIIAIAFVALMGAQVALAAHQSSCKPNRVLQLLDVRFPAGGPVAHGCSDGSDIVVWIEGITYTRRVDNGQLARCDEG